MKVRPASEFGLHYGDLGVIAIALFFLFGFLWLMFSPAPLKGLDKFDQASAKDSSDRLAKLAKAKRMKEIQADEAAGVVTVGIVPTKH